jgi:hypothetical protein
LDVDDLGDASLEAFGEAHRGELRPGSRAPSERPSGECGSGVFAAARASALMVKRGPLASSSDVQSFNGRRA